MIKRTIKDTTDRKILNSLERWIESATPSQRQSGMHWYSEAQQWAKYLAETFGINRYKSAAVISALSPNNKWERNKVDAFNVCQAWKDGKTANDVKVCTYGANKKKAFEILSGETEITADSPKTHAFAANVGLLAADFVTVDKWHIRACLCSPKEGIKDSVESCTAAQYRRIEALTLILARKYGLKGYELQAIIWVSIKENWGR
tara:strand:+ start:475 stop:1086 length:612 start_codon:yes stop_codon:yes gene_type:complete